MKYNLKSNLLGKLLSFGANVCPAGWLSFKEVTLFQSKKIQIIVIAKTCHQNFQLLDCGFWLLLEEMPCILSGLYWWWDESSSMCEQAEGRCDGLFPWERTCDLD